MKLLRRFIQTAFLIALALLCFSQVPEQDSLALVQFYNTANGPKWKVAIGPGQGNSVEWYRSDEPVSKWYRVFVENEVVHKLQIDEWISGIAGPLTPKLGDLSAPVEIDIRRNKLSGLIPNSLTKLVSLRELSLAFTDLESPIPDLSSLRNLETLILATSKFSEPLPQWLWSLTALVELQLDGNEFSGTIPTSIENLGNLEYLSFGANDLYGELPDQLWNLTRLKQLTIYSNQFKGTISSDIKKLENLETLWLFENQFIGKLPGEISQLSQLKHLALDDNEFEGSLPYMPMSIRTIVMRSNQFDGLPDFDQTNLRRLNVEGNKLTFEDLEQVASMNLDQFTYSPQACVDIEVQPKGQEQVLSVNIGGENTVYKWYHNGEAVQEGPDSFLVVAAFDPDDDFSCEATNTLLPDLVICTNPLGTAEGIIINSPGDDGLDSNAPNTVCSTGKMIDTNGDGMPDTYECTLRAAIELVNKQKKMILTGITFKIPEDDLKSILPGSEYPEIRYPINMDASQQPGGKIVISGEELIRTRTSETIGFLLREESILKNLVVANFHSGIHILNSQDYQMSDLEFISNSSGVAPADIEPQKSGKLVINRCKFLNHSDVGIAVFNFRKVFIENSTFGLVGGQPVGNKTGISVQSSDSVIILNSVISSNRVGMILRGNKASIIEGNRIGTDSEGFGSFGNSDAGITLSENEETEIRNNVISNNRVGLGGLESTNKIITTKILDNKIGTDITGTKALGNEDGILFQFVFSGTLEISNNTISGNSGLGLKIVKADKVEIIDNRVGVASNGIDPLPNLGNGMQFSGISILFIDDNVISGNTGRGITMNGCTNFRISGNNIGMGLHGLVPVANNLGVEAADCQGKIVKNVIAGNKNGLFLNTSIIKLTDNDIGLPFKGNTSVGVAMFGVNSSYDLAHNRIVKNETGIIVDAANVFIRNSAILNNELGIYLKKIVAGSFSLKQSKISGNRICQNSTGLIGEASDFLVRLNEICANEGAGSGIHLTSSTARMSENHIYGDRGDAIFLDPTSIAVSVDNNFFNNEGLAINNKNNLATTNASNNWWGDASGPSGAGPGSGDAISANVDFSNWKTKPFGLTAATFADTIFVPQGDTTEIPVFVQNWLIRDDWVAVDAFDEENWRLRIGDVVLSEQLEDSLARQYNFRFVVPENPSLPESRVTAIATSFTFTGALPEKDTVQFLLVAQVPTLDRIILFPDSAFSKPGDSVQFSYFAVDQFDRPFELNPVWRTDGGQIGSTGLFIAGNDPGCFSVIISDPDKTVISEVFICIEIASVLSRIDLLPDIAFLHPGDTVQFIYSGYDQFGNPIDFTPIWSAGGGQIDESGRYIAGNQAGVFSVSLTDTTHLVTAASVITIEKTTSYSDPDTLTQLRFEAIPNPFVDLITIFYDLPNKGVLQLDVFDLSGRLVATLLREWQEAGLHSFRWNGNTSQGIVLEGGIYILRLKIEEHQKAIKITKTH